MKVLSLIVSGNYVRQCNNNHIILNLLTTPLATTTATKSTTSTRPSLPTPEFATQTVLLRQRQRRPGVQQLRGGDRLQHGRARQGGHLRRRGGRELLRCWYNEESRQDCGRSQDNAESSRHRRRHLGRQLPRRIGLRGLERASRHQTHQSNLINFHTMMNFVNVCFCHFSCAIS